MSHTDSTTTFQETKTATSNTPLNSQPRNVTQASSPQCDIASQNQPDFWVSLEQFCLALPQVAGNTMLAPAIVENFRNRYSVLLSQLSLDDMEEIVASLRC